MNPQKFLVDPMKEGHPEAFSEPQTIPAGWNVSDWLTPTPGATHAENTDPATSFPHAETEVLQ